MMLHIKKFLQQRINVLLKKIENSDFNSYDYMDYWATCTSVKSKQLAYQTEPFGHIFFLFQSWLVNYGFLF